MNHPSDEEDRRLIVEEAARWFAQLERGDAQDQRRFVKWLNQSPEHSRRFLEVAAVGAMLEGPAPGRERHRGVNTMGSPVADSGTVMGGKPPRPCEGSALEHDLRSALENGEFVLRYQPKVEIETRRLAGVEALLRWQCPERGLVQPAEFIPILEETGMIVDVGEWVFRQAAIDRSRWIELGLDAPRIALNISSEQLRHEDFVANLTSAQKPPGTDVGFDIEVTESAFMADVETAIGKLTVARSLGFRVVLDDFGTGYSSLSHLRRLPLDALKIDRAFIRGLPEEDTAVELVKCICSLAHSFKLEVVAEGVESEMQVECLASMGCDQIQGSVIGMPKAFEEITSYLKGDRADAGLAALTA